MSPAALGKTELRKRTGGKINITTGKGNFGKNIGTSII